LPRLKPIQSPSSAAKRKTFSSCWRPPQPVSKAKKRKPAPWKAVEVPAAAADADTSQIASSESVAKPKHSCGDAGVKSRPPPSAESARKAKERWKTLVRQSVPVAVSGDDDVGAASTSATENRASQPTTENQMTTTAQKTCSAECSGGSATDWTSSSTSPRRPIHLTNETDMAEMSSHVCHRRPYDRRSAVSPPLPSSSSSTTSHSSSSSWCWRKRTRPLDGDCDCPTATTTMTTKCGCYDDRSDYYCDGSCPPESTHRGCRCCPVRHDRRPRCYHCSSRRHHLGHGCDSRRAVQYGALPASCQPLTRQSARDHSYVDVTSTGRSMIPHSTASTPSSYSCHVPCTNGYQHTAELPSPGIGKPLHDRLPFAGSIKQEPPDDFFDADGRNRRTLFSPTSSSFEADANSVVSVGIKSPTLNFRPIPLEPVVSGGLSMNEDPRISRRPRRRQQQQQQSTTYETNSNTNDDELDVTQSGKVKRKEFF